MAFRSSKKITTGLVEDVQTGVPVPLAGGVKYSTGTITLVAGSNEATGATTEWVANLVVNYRIKTAADKFYRVMKILSDTKIEISPAAVANESTATYEAYETPRTDRILIRCITASDLWYICTNTGSKADGHEVTAQAQVELLVDLYDADIWIDVGTNDSDFTYLLEQDA